MSEPSASLTEASDMKLVTTQARVSSLRNMSFARKESYMPFLVTALTPGTEETRVMI